MITLAISYTTSYVSVGVLSGAVHTRPNTIPTQCTTNATIHAIPHCIKTTPAAARALPSSRLTAAIAATQGVYSRVNTRNTMPVNGVNSVVSAAVSPPRRTVSVETTLSLAVKPVISAVETRQSPKPSGLNRGAIKLPMAGSCPPKRPRSDACQRSAGTRSAPLPQR